MPRQKITTCLWFNTQAEEAARFYVSLFPDSRINNLSRYTENGPGPVGAVMPVEFTLGGVHLLALNGGPDFQFTEAVSLSVDCQTQEEIDFLWEKLTEGGAPGRCGWLKDRYGLSWQIVPSILPQLLSSPTSAAKVFSTLLQMTRIDIRQLINASHGA